MRNTLRCRERLSLSSLQIAGGQRHRPEGRGAYYFTLRFGTSLVFLKNYMRNIRPAIRNVKKILCCSHCQTQRRCVAPH